MNEPKKIYLQVGEQYNAEKDDFREFVSYDWEKHPIHTNDLEFTRLDSVWHDAQTETPEDGTEVLAEFDISNLTSYKPHFYGVAKYKKGHGYDYRCVYYLSNNVIRWANIEDLLPKKK